MSNPSNIFIVEILYSNGVTSTNVVFDKDLEYALDSCFTFNTDAVEVYNTIEVRPGIHKKGKLIKRKSW